MIDDLTRDRARGALVGLAVGEALGVTLDVGPRIEKRSAFHRTMAGGGIYRLAPGQWSGLTAQALALGDAIVCQNGRLDTDSVMSRWLEWRKAGKYSCTDSCIGLGRTMHRALDRYEEIGEGNGYMLPVSPEIGGGEGIGRLAPAAVAGRDVQQAIALAQAQSTLTHPSRTCQDVAGHMADRLWHSIASQRFPKIGADVHSMPRERVRTTGNVVDTYQAAMWAVDRTFNFGDALVEAVNLGYSAALVGAAAGQLAGAQYGLSGIPYTWRRDVAWLGRLIEMADALVELRERPRRRSEPQPGDPIDHTPDWGFNGQKY